MEHSALAELASLASSSLAVDLTYLILDRFKYRESIRDHARRALELLRDKSSSVDKDHEDKGIYQGLRFLAMLPITSTNINLKEVIPSFKLRKLYPWIYASRMDRWSTIICVIYSMLCLFVGRGYGIGLDIGLQRLPFFAIDSFLWVSYWILCLGVTIPILFVTVGSWIRESAHSKIDHDRMEMEKFMQYFSSKAKITEDNDDDKPVLHGE